MSVKVWIHRHPFIFALAYSGIITCLMLIFGIVRGEGSDDFSMSQLLMGTCGEVTPYACYISYYLSTVVVLLQRILPYINWLTGLEVLSVWFSFTIMQWFLLKHSRRSTAWIGMVFCLIFEPIFLFALQYTRSAFILPFAGLLLIYDSCIGKLYADDFNGGIEKHNFVYKMMETIGGVCLCIFGTFFRYHCLYICIAYIFILIFSYFISVYKIRAWNKECIFRIVAVVLAIGFVIFGALVLRYINISIYEEWYKNNTFREYSKARYNVTDYMPSQYSVEWSSNNLEITENDYLMIRQFVINDNYFSKEYFEDVRRNIDTATTSNNSVEHVYNLKQIFKYRTGRLSGNRTLFGLCVAFFALAFLFCNRKNGLSLILDLLGTVALIVYFLIGERLPPWVIDPIYMMAAFIALVELIVQGSVEALESRGFSRKKMIMITVIVISLCERVSVFGKAVDAQWKNEDLVKLIHYAEDSREVFLLDNISWCPYPYIDVYGDLAYFDVGQWKNIIRVGNWDVEHPMRNMQKEALRIDSVIYSLVEGKAYLITSSDLHTYDMYRKFFLEHYDICVDYYVEKTFGDYSIIGFRKVYK